MLLATEVDLTPLIYALVGLIIAITGVVTAFGKLILKRMDQIGKNAQETADTLNHRKDGDPTMKNQVDVTKELSEKTHDQVIAIGVEASDAKSKAEKAHDAAMEAKKLAQETKLEVIEVKKIARKLEDSSDILLDYFARLGKRIDERTQEKQAR